MKHNILSARTLLVASALVVTSFFGCQKASDMAATNPTGPAGDSLMAQKNAVNATVSESNSDNAVFALIQSESAVQDTIDCETRTFMPSDSVYPRTVNINFGTGCADKFGRIRKGRVSITYSGPLDSSGSVAATVFQGFYIDTVKISGKHLVQNITRKGGSVPTYSYLIDRTSQYPDGDYGTSTSNKTYTQTEGLGNTSNDDDGFEISGSTMGVNYTNGQRTNYTATIDVKHPIHDLNSCQFPDRGVIIALVTIPKGSTFRETLDYGNGTCDDQAVLTYKNQSMNITLPLQFWPTF